jgi:flagellar protein FlbD
MILVKKINQQEIVVNCELIETIEFVPHAVMSLTTGEKVIVDETAEEIIRKVIDFKRALHGRGLELRVIHKRPYPVAEEA